MATGTQHPISVLFDLSLFSTASLVAEAAAPEPGRCARTVFAGLEVVF